MYKGTVSISPFMCELGSSQCGSVYFQLLRLSSERVLYAFSMYRSSSSTPGVFPRTAVLSCICVLPPWFHFCFVDLAKAHKTTAHNHMLHQTVVVVNKYQKFDAFAISTERSRTMKRERTQRFGSKRKKRWCIAVQKNGTRKRFYSSTPGRTGQREANAKADAWLDDSIRDGKRRSAPFIQSGWKS